MIITVECLLMATLAQGPVKIVPVTISCTDTTCNRTTYMWLIVCFILVLCPKQTVPWMWMEVQGELLLCTKDSRLKLKLGKLWGQKTWYISLWNLSRRQKEILVVYHLQKNVREQQNIWKVVLFFQMECSKQKLWTNWVAHVNGIQPLFNNTLVKR